MLVTAEAMLYLWTNAKKVTASNRNYFTELQRIMKGLTIMITGLALTAFHVTTSAELGPVPKLSRIDKKVERVNVPFDLDTLKKNWRSRIATIRESGKLPIIDIESSYKEKGLNPKRFAKQMDKYGVALIAFSPQIGKKEGRFAPPTIILKADGWHHPTRIALSQLGYIFITVVARFTLGPALRHDQDHIDITLIHLLNYFVEF